jgi:hypothetical protein
MKDYLVSFDMFGVRPTLEFNGKRQYKSCYGAFISSLALIFIAFFMIIKLSEPEEDQYFLNLMDEAFGGDLVFARSNLPEVEF